MNKLFSTLLVCLMCITASANTVFTWTGAAGTSNWKTPGNWSKSGDATTATYPQNNTHDVIIPASKTDAVINVYPELSETTTVHDIFFELVLMDDIVTTNSARLGKQHLLVYNKAYYDLTIKANRYVRVASPLKNTYAGDYYAKHQTTTPAAWGEHFLFSTYTATEGSEFVETSNGVSTAVNRAVRPTYCSFYDKNLRIVTAYDEYNFVNEFRSKWATPTNLLEIPIETASCFDVWVDNGAAVNSSEKDGYVTLHFPSSNSTYAYYDVNGNLSATRSNAQTPRTADAGKFELNQETLKVKLEHKGTNSPMYAVGNPGFAYLQIQSFLSVNNAAKHLVPYIYTHVEELGKRGSEKIYYLHKDPNSGVETLYRINDVYKQTTEDQLPNKPNPLTNEIATNKREGYLNPAEGFRLIGGKTAYTCNEPRLVGIYSTGTFKYAQQVVDKYYNGTTKKTDYNTTGKEIPMLQNPTVNVSYSITTVPNHPDQVRINNFLGRGSVVATIIPSATEEGKGQLKIVAGTPIMNVMSSDGNDYNDTWDYDHVDGKDIAKSGTLTGYNVISGDNDLDDASETPSSGSGTRMTTTATNVGNAPSGTYKMNSRILKIYGITDLTTATTNSWSFRDGCPHAYADGKITAFNISNTNTQDVYLDYVISGNNVSINMTNKFFLASDAVRQAPHEQTVAGGTKSFSLSNFTESLSANLAPISITTTNATKGTFSVRISSGGTMTIASEGLTGGNITKVVLKGYSNSYPARDWTPSVGTGSVNGKYNYTWTGDTESLTLSLKGVDMAYVQTFEITYADGTALVDNNPAFNTIMTSSRGGSWSGYQCEAWFAYDEFVSSKTNTDATDGKDFIMEDYDAEGAFTSWVRLNLANNTLHPAHGYYYQKNSSSAKYPIYISRVLGSYDVVSITGLYPGCYNAPILGRITKGSGPNDYTMTLPSGQLTHIAAADGTPNPANDHYFYAHGNQTDMKANMVLTWNNTKKMWILKDQTGGNSCYEAMVAHQGIQPDANQDNSSYQTNFMDGLVLGIRDSGKTSKSANTFFLEYVEDAEIPADAEGTETPGDAGFLEVTYSSPMFFANIPATASAPQRVAANDATAPLMITAQAGDMSASTMVITSAVADNRYSRREDAPIFDAQSADFCLGTLAGSQLVGVNSVQTIDMLPLYISESATLNFSGTNGTIVLYDALNDVSTPVVDGADYPVVIAEGEEAGRYFIISTDQSTTDVEDVRVELDWKPVAFCPASGSLAVSCAADEVSFEVFNLSGQMVGSASGSHTFSGLSTGAYIVKATRGAELQSLKVIVY